MPTLVGMWGEWLFLGLPVLWLLLIQALPAAAGQLRQEGGRS